MDCLGNRSDEHADCGGEILLNKQYDSYYCSGCGKWIEEKCSDLDCGFCKDRPEKPPNLNSGDS